MGHYRVQKSKNVWEKARVLDYDPATNIIHYELHGKTKKVAYNPTRYVREQVPEPPIILDGELRESGDMTIPTIEDLKRQVYAHRSIGQAAQLAFRIDPDDNGFTKKQLFD